VLRDRILELLADAVRSAQSETAPLPRISVAGAPFGRAPGLSLEPSPGSIR
jgi:hypothetical protein